MFLHLLHLANIGRIWVLRRLLCHFIHAPDPEYFFDNAVSVCSKGENFLFGNLSFTHVIIRVFGLREDVSINRTNSKYCGKSPKFVFSPTFIFCSPICPNNCGEVFLWKYILVFEKWYFSFDRSNMQIFTVNITRTVRLHVTNLFNLRHFYGLNPLFYHLKLIPCRYWSWQRNIYFLVNIFVQHTFSMSKSSIKTKTVLTMTDMTESTEFIAFKRQKDGYKVAIKISLCNCVVLSWDELKFRQNLLASNYEIYMMCLLVATVYWHKSLQFVKKSYMTLLPCLFMILLAVSMINLCSTTFEPYLIL